jgi:hypothetical protein
MRAAVRWLVFQCILPVARTIVAGFPAVARRLRSRVSVSGLLIKNVRLHLNSNEANYLQTTSMSVSDMEVKTEKNQGCSYFRPRFLPWTYKLPKEYSAYFKH